ncbi:sugar diacid recognition domain-containing protein [Fredinandcohnia sp. QZ13]|uniref:CdaR family transcriptional regulator n=1 Tax=Fredinandcohnia sp. QZ13 TaxID=3073144 RepID=UPI0028535F25|nr:sugar diacid recognition domain-containing protein [Fredinandcohnia sp. QZ13]MDR4886862.1 sugar diacid recognition domain-containing protein [Fredinandcohnia sp. QZ13]
MLIPSLAKKIINEVRRLIDEDIIVVDVSGTIIASTDTSRIGNFHEGALLASRDEKKMIITKEMENHLKGVKAGINLPILFKQKVVGVIGITGNPDQVSAYGELLKKMTELLIQESYYAEQFEMESRALETFVFDWVQGKEESGEFIKRAEHLNIDIERKRQVVFASIKSDTEVPIRPISNRLQQSSFLNENEIFVRWGNEQFLLLLTDRSKEQIQKTLQKLKKEIESSFSVKLSFGIGSEDYLLRQSFDEADRALQIAKRTNSIQFDDDLKLEMLIHETSGLVQIEYVKRTIAKLLGDYDLLLTLLEYTRQNQSIKDTAEALHIHVNTLSYRFNKIEEKTGLHPRNFVDLTTLYLGILLLDRSIKVVE